MKTARLAAEALRIGAAGYVLKKSAVSEVRPGDKGRPGRAYLCDCCGRSGSLVKTEFQPRGIVSRPDSTPERGAAIPRRGTVHERGRLIIWPDGSNRGISQIPNYGISGIAQHPNLCSTRPNGESFNAYTTPGATKMHASVKPTILVLTNLGLRLAPESISDGLNRDCVETQTCFCEDFAIFPC
jgi:hypothetical protein